MCKGEFRLRNFTFWYPVRRDFTDSRVSHVTSLCLTQGLLTGERGKDSGVLGATTFSVKDRLSSLEIPHFIFVFIFLISQ